MSSESLSQKILRNTQQAAEDTRAIRSMLETHLGTAAEATTAQQNNPEQLVPVAPEQTGTAPLEQPENPPEAASVHTEHVKEDTEQSPEQAPEALTKTEQILARFKRNAFGGE